MSDISSSLTLNIITHWIGAAILMPKLQSAQLLTLQALHITAGAWSWGTPRSHPFYARYNITPYKYSHDQLRHPEAEPPAPLQAVRHFSSGPGSSFLWDPSRKRGIPLADPRLPDPKALGRTIEDEYAVMREKYGILPSPFCLETRVLIAI